MDNLMVLQLCKVFVGAAYWEGPKSSREAIGCSTQRRRAKPPAPGLQGQLMPIPALGYSCSQAPQKPPPSLSALFLVTKQALWPLLPVQACLAPTGFRGNLLPHVCRRTWDTMAQTSEQSSFHSRCV